jgi:hypothetical protein
MRLRVLSRRVQPLLGIAMPYAMFRIDREAVLRDWTCAKRDICSRTKAGRDTASSWTLKLARTHVHSLEGAENDEVRGQVTWIIIQGRGELIP